jgi:hypothetical protein
MRIDNAFPSTYLKASDLQGNTVTVRMSHVKMEDIGGDHKPILYFQNKEKGLVLNKTNSNNIAAIYGPETDDWAGQPIDLFPTMVDFQGKSVEAIRCRASRNAPRTSAQHPHAPPQYGNGNGHQPAPAAEAQPRPLPPRDLDDEIPF